MNPRRRNSLAASPLLIGALTVLIAVVAVYVSYGANNGLPFTPTYDIKVELPEGSGLEPGNQVRLFGKRVGIVTKLAPHQNPRTGRFTAVVSVKLEKHVGPLPADTTTEVQSVSDIGLKYLELTRGKSSRTIPQGATIPASQSREPVEIQDLFNIFDKRTRAAIQQNTNEFGDGYAGRGAGLNNTIHVLRPLTEKAVPVLRNLASPQTALGQLTIALDKAAQEVSPVAETQASLFRELAIFFTAYASASPSLERAIEGGPTAARQAIYSLPHQRRFFEATTEFFRRLRPSAKLLVTVAPPLGHALSVGAVNLHDAAALNAELASSLQALELFSTNPQVSLGLEEVTRTFELGTPLFAGLAPAQANCNYFTLAFRNLANLLSESIGNGTVLRVVPLLSPSGVNDEGLPASAPANGTSQDYDPTTKSFIEDNHLHYNPYPYVSGPGQPKECEAGNIQFIPGKTVIGNTSTTLGTNHEETKRSENLFGEKYSASQQKAFPKESSSKSKGKQS
jgi:virulence factor Mce-like protein